MDLDCKNCKSKISISDDENALEGKLISCSLCKDEFIYHSKTFFLESRLTELDNNLAKKESDIHQQNSLYNDKIKLLELELLDKKNELEKQAVLEKKIYNFENRITETEKLNSHQADLETKIFNLEKNLKKISDDILDKNANFEKKANYLEMKATSTNNDTDENQLIAVNVGSNDIVNFGAYEKNDAKEKVKKNFFWPKKNN